MLQRHVRSRIHRPPKPFFTRPAIRHISKTTDNVFCRADLHDCSPRTFRDFLTPYRVGLLNLTLAPYLPMTLAPPSDPSTLPPGHHFIFFPSSTSERDTLSDGYEKHFAPKYPFARRLWTLGRLEFTRRGLTMGQWAMCKEELENVMDYESGTDVWISRKMYPEGQENNEWTVKESRCLRYLRQLPAAQEPISTASPPSKDYERAVKDLLLIHKFTPTQHLLTRFSYLTFNFHRIHIDKTYSREIEKYPSTLVHGSLSITLILTILRQYYSSKNAHLEVGSVKYVMYRPLHVDSQISLTITVNEENKRHRAILWDSSFKKAVECIVYPFP